MENIQVLIIEDDLKISEIQTRFTEKIAGYTVIGIANSIEEANEMLEVLQPDLVLLDIYFPDGNGIELLWKIRSRYRKMEVILITAAKEPGPLAEAIRGGVFDYILKPMMFQRFQETLIKFKEYKQKINSLETVEQQDIDSLLHANPVPDEKSDELPKGIDVLTLDKIKKFLGNSDKSFSADQIGEKVGMSRTTARRYLEYLVSQGIVAVDLDYGTIGRPERKYNKILK